MTGTIDWNELVRLCKRNRPDAQQKVYNLLSSKMFGVCLRYAKDRTEAEDILQDGFLRVFTKIGQFDFKGSFEGWVRRVIVNCALERYRKQNLLYSVSEIGEYDTHLSADDVLSEISAGELLQMVQELHGDPGVLRGDKVRILQGLPAAPGDVPQVADGGPHQIQYPSHS